MELAREYYRFEAHYFGVSRSEGKLQPAEKRLDEAATHTLEQLRTELDAARQAWIESMLRP